MSWAHRIQRMFSRLRNPQTSEAGLDDEVQAYFAEMVERRVSQGLNHGEAQCATRLEFGSPELVKEEIREARTGNGLETICQDFRYAVRGLRKAPGFAVAAVLSLGLGLGANTAVFTLMNTVLLKSLPVKAARRLFFVDTSGGKERGASGPPYPCYERLRDGSHYFSGMAAFSGERFPVTIDGTQELVGGQYASGTYFHVLGVGAVLGRVMTAAEDSVARQRRAGRSGCRDQLPSLGAAIRPQPGCARQGDPGGPAVGHDCWGHASRFLRVDTGHAGGCHDSDLTQQRCPVQGHVVV